MDVLIKKREKLGFTIDKRETYLKNQFDINVNQLTKQQASKVIMDLNDPKKIKEIKKIVEGPEGVE